VAEGNENAFRILFDKYRDKIFSVAYKITKEEALAEDVVQEVFIKLWLHKEKLPALDNFGAYLNVLTRNHIFSQLRKLATEENYLRELIRQHELENKNQPDVVLYNELRKMLTIAIASLPPQQKKVFQLGKMEGKKYDEIASILNISKETVKDHMMKASGAIKAYLQRNEGLLYMLVLFIRPL